MEMNVEQLVKMSEAWLPVVLEYSGKLTLALITVLIGWWLVGKLTSSIGRLLDMRQVDRALGSFIGSLASIEPGAGAAPPDHAGGRTVV